MAACGADACRARLDGRLDITVLHQVYEPLVTHVLHG